MKYMKEYLVTKSRDEFVNVVLKKYKDIKEATAKRRWYDCRKALTKDYIIKTHKYLPQEKVKPSPLKMIEYEDMKRFRHKITRDELTKYGFKQNEINWLEDEGMLSGKS